MTDCKCFLYAWLGKRKILPDYRYKPPPTEWKTHNSSFEFTVTAAGYDYTGLGKGKNKKIAQTNAAFDFCQYLIKYGHLSRSDLPHNIRNKLYEYPSTEKSPKLTRNEMEQNQNNKESIHRDDSIIEINESSESIKPLNTESLNSKDTDPQKPTNKKKFTDDTIYEDDNESASDPSYVSNWGYRPVADTLRSYKGNYPMYNLRRCREVVIKVLEETHIPTHGQNTKYNHNFITMEKLKFKLGVKQRVVNRLQKRICDEIRKETLEVSEIAANRIDLVNRNFSSYKNDKKSLNVSSSQ